MLFFSVLKRHFFPFILAFISCRLYKLADFSNNFFIHQFSFLRLIWMLFGCLFVYQIINGKIGHFTRKYFPILFVSALLSVTLFISFFTSNFVDRPMFSYINQMTYFLLFFSVLMVDRNWCPFELYLNWIVLLTFAGIILPYFLTGPEIARIFSWNTAGYANLAMIHSETTLRSGLILKEISRLSMRFLDANNSAYLIATAALIIFSYMLKKKEGFWYFILAGFLFSLLLIKVVLSHSRGSFMYLFIGIIVMKNYVSFKKMAVVFVPTCVSFFAGIRYFAPVHFTEFINRYVNFANYLGLTESRIYTGTESCRINAFFFFFSYFIDAPFFGYGIVPSTLMLPNTSHIFYLQWLTTYGLFGFMLLLYFLFYIYYGFYHLNNTLQEHSSERILIPVFLVCILFKGLLAPFFPFEWIIMAFSVRELRPLMSGVSFSKIPA